MPWKKGGTPAATLAAAVAAIERENLGTLTVSPFYASAPVPRSDQPWYVNAVIAMEGCTVVEADQLLGRLHRLEDRFGRERNARWAARTLDLDLLAFDQRIFGWQRRQPGPDDGSLIVPHARLHERLFVLRPLADLLPAWRHPVLGHSVAQMLADLPPGQDLEQLEMEC